MSRLTPGDMPRQSPVQPVHTIEGREDGFTEDSLELPDAVIAEMTEGLAKLREPFPADMIEKLPKPMFKGAWDGKRGAQCSICHGRHVLDDAIHLDYVGHANTTNRLLEVDPFWEWEPLTYTDAGLPLFDKVGGLWIKLTICGVTRLGYGDGANPKEIIGDAIRNAAMRFGVALDLWSKIDLHAERNPGDGQTPDQRSARQSDEVPRERLDRQASQTGDGDKAPNQDALDSLGSVCDENGFDRRTMRDAYDKWAQSKRYRDRDLLTAHRDRIYKFAEHLLEGADPVDGGADSSDEAQAGTEDDPTANAGQSGGQPEPAAGASGESDTGGHPGGEEAGDSGGDEAQANPLDTSDVEKQDGDAF